VSGVNYKLALDDLVVVVSSSDPLLGHDIPQFGPIGAQCWEQFSSKTAERRRRVTGLYSIADGDDEGKTKTNNNIGFNTEYAQTSNKKTKSANRPNHVPHHYCERWEDMISDVDLMFQWAIANRLNKIEWLLLNNYKWGDEVELRHGECLV